MKYNMFYGSLLVLVFVFGNTSQEGVDDCHIKVIDLPPNPVTNYKSQTVLLQSFIFILRSNTTSHVCSVDMSSIIKVYQKENLIGVPISYLFICVKPMTLLFSGIDEAVNLTKQIDNITFRHSGRSQDNLVLRHCSVKFSNFFNVLQNIQLAVIDLRDIGIDDTTETLTQTFSTIVNKTVNKPMTNNSVTYGCKNLLSIYNFVLSDIVNFSMDSFVSHLSCEPSFPRMMILTLRNLSIIDFPDILKEKFPNLQTLNLESNDLVEPPSFPWTQRFLLPGKKYFNQTAFAVGKDKRLYQTQISNFFLPVLNLKGNKIEVLRNHALSGFMNELHLDSNGMEKIGELSLANVTGLKSLQLGNNRLRTLPPVVFNGQYDLEFLDLSNNLLSNLHQNLFKDLISLRVLHLESNYLKSIDSHLFTPLISVRSIHLDNNQIEKIYPYSFPIQNLNLENVSMSENHLQNIPDDMFYICKLKVANLKRNNISCLNFTRLVDRINSYQFNMLENNPIERKIDLTENKISHIDADTTFDTIKYYQLTYIMTNFKFLLTGNPLQCFCNIVDFVEYINTFKNRSLKGNEYFFNDWKCASPTEFAGREMFSMQAEETYCKMKIPDCPSECTCYKRFQSNISIVDCRDKALMNFPTVLPRGVLDLRFERNNISAIVDQSYVHRIRRLRLSFNQINIMEGSALSQLTSLEVLNLDSNLLTYIPKQLQSIHLTSLRLGSNPYKCDCKTLWLKNWISTHKEVIEDVQNIKCAINSGDKGKLMLEVSTGEFICVKESRLEMILIPILGTLSLTCVLLIIVYHMTELRIFLYVQFGIRLCDRDDFDDNETIDVVVVYPENMYTWVSENILTYLNKNKVRTCVMPRDLIAGYTFQHNISNAMRKSKKMILVLEDLDHVSDNCRLQVMKACDSHPDEFDMIMKMAWCEAFEKIKYQRKNYVIVTGTKAKCKSIQNDDLRTYLHVKKGRYVDVNDRYFTQKLFYYLDVKIHVPLSCDGGVTNRLTDLSNEGNASNDLLVVYSDTDRDLAVPAILQPLQKRGFSCLHEEDFTPGEPVLDGFVDAIRKSMHTVFLLPADADFDYNLINAFRFAREKSDTAQFNHLIVIKKNASAICASNQEVMDYLSIHVCLCLLDNDYQEKLCFSLTSPGGNYVTRSSLPEYQTDNDKSSII